tara:strand:+ start:1529 stop:2143 length:615 start_codon:yes stop_codon:yes gene_type:complete
MKKNLSKKRKNILIFAKKIVPEVGWNEKIYSEISRKYKISKNEIYALFPNFIDILKYYLEDLDTEMIEEVKKLKINNLKTHEKIIEIIIKRLEKNLKDKKLIKRTFFTLSFPNNFNIFISSTYNTVNNIWYLANDNSYDFNFYTKRLILFYIYISTLIFWLNDKENKIDKTRFFLSKQIKKTSSLKKIKDIAGNFINKFKKYSY